MPVPTSNQGAESKRWLVPLLASSEARRAVALYERGPVVKPPLCFGGTERVCERWSPAGKDAGGVPAGWGACEPKGRGWGSGVERCSSLYRFINFEDQV